MATPRVFARRAASSRRVAVRPSGAKAPGRPFAFFRALFPALVALAAAVPTALPGADRDWIDNTGKFTIVAELQAVEGDVAQLKKKEDGKIVAVPLDKLGPEPRAYAREQSARLKWTSNPAELTPPEMPAQGMVRGVKFKPTRVELAGQTLTLHGGEPTAPVKIAIHLFLKQGESLGGRKFTVPTTTKLREPAVVVSYPSDQPFETEHEDHYLGEHLLRLEFGRAVGRRVPAAIHLCLPDESKSFVAGELTVTTP